MSHSGKIQQCPPWTQGLKLQENSRVHLRSQFSTVEAPSCGVDLHDVVIGGRQHQDLLHVAVVEDLSGAERVQPRHGYPLLLVVATAHRVHAAPAADACRVHLVIQQRQTVVLHAAVWRRSAEVSASVLIVVGMDFFLFSTRQQFTKPEVELTRVWLVENTSGVRQVLQNLYPGVGEVPGKQRHHLNLHLLTGSSCHWHRHQPWALPTHGPVTVAISHWGDKQKQGHADSQSTPERLQWQQGPQCSNFWKILLISLWSVTSGQVFPNHI